MKVRKRLGLLGIGIILGVSLTGCLKLEEGLPQALFTASPTQYVIPFTASFDATMSYASSGDIVTYMWAFGDGGSDTGAVVDHTYTTDGDYVVTLTVIDSKGLSTSRTLDVQALNPAPTASYSYSPKSSYEGSYIVSCSETVTFTAENCEDDGEIVKYEWYFGYRDDDGNPVTAEGETVTHEFLYAGTYKVTLTVTDDDGATTDYVEELEVVGSTPCYADTCT